jgi:hypothetical protein
MDQNRPDVSLERKAENFEGANGSPATAASCPVAYFSPVFSVLLPACAQSSSTESKEDSDVVVKELGSADTELV